MRVRSSLTAFLTRFRGKTSKGTERNALIVAFTAKAPHTRLKALVRDGLAGL
jgi:hypothetical protein